MNANNVVLVFIFLLGVSFLLAIFFIAFSNILKKFRWWLLKNRIERIYKNDNKTNIAESIIDLNLLKLKSEDIEQKFLAINSIMSMQKEWQNDQSLKRKIIQDLFQAMESEPNIDIKMKMMKLIYEVIEPNEIGGKSDCIMASMLV